MKKIFLVLIILCQNVEAAYDSTNLRYLSGHEIVIKLSSVLPVAFQDFTKVGKCIIDEKSFAAVGFVNPQTGKSVYKEPSAAFLNWYQPCLAQALLVELESSRTLSEASLHLGPLDKKVAALITEKYSKVSPLTIPAAAFSEAEIGDLVAYHVERIIGPDEVIESLETRTSGNELRAALLKELKKIIGHNPSVNLLQLLSNLETEILLRDEFFIY
ncbi:MAG: hypothetical protein IPM97_06805 [Bdellovibrionaceae bacterium]|nr:hypothetical protein [Pseudobdellovibrionaceae bacterium]